MGRAEDLLFGKIAVGHHMVTAEQLAECVAAQAMAAEPLPLGRVMLDKGFVTKSQLDRIAQLQRESLDRVEPVTRLKREDILFGKVAVQLGYATAEEVHRCLRTQALEEEQGRPPLSLGEILVEKGCLTASQVHRILSSQKKVMMVCLSCKTRFNVVTARDPASLMCPRCRGQLIPAQTGGVELRQDATVVLGVSDVLPSVAGPVPAGGPAAERRLDPSGPGRPAAEDTTTRRRASVGSPTPRASTGSSSTRLPVTGRPPAAAPTPPAGPAAGKVQCPICDHLFAAAPDPSGWVKCPQCQTGFAPKGG